MESRSLPVIYLDDVANTNRSSPGSARGEGRSRAEEEGGLAESWDLSPNPRARTRMRPDPPQYFFGGGSGDPRQENRGSNSRARSLGGTRSSSERRGREDIGQRYQDEGGQSSASHSDPRQGSRGAIQLARWRDWAPRSRWPHGSHKGRQGDVWVLGGAAQSVRVQISIGIWLFQPAPHLWLVTVLTVP